MAKGPSFLVGPTCQRRYATVCGPGPVKLVKTTAGVGLDRGIADVAHCARARGEVPHGFRRLLREVRSGSGGVELRFPQNYG